MPTKSHEPLIKVTLNLYHADLIKLRSRYGHGYSERVREWVRERLRRSETQGFYTPSHATIEDLDTDG